MYIYVLLISMLNKYGRNKTTIETKIIYRYIQTAQA